MNKLWILWHKNKISQNKKLRMSNADILPILLYNCGTWSLTKTGEKKLYTFLRRLLRRVISVFDQKNLKWWTILQVVPEKLSTTIRNKRPILLEHVLRLSPDSHAQTSMNAYFHALTKPTRVWAKATIVSVLQKNLEFLNITLNNLGKLHEIWTATDKNKRQNLFAMNNVFNYDFFFQKMNVSIK